MELDEPLIPKDHCLTRTERQRHREHDMKRQTHGEEGCINSEVEIGVLFLQVSECLGIPEAGRGKEGSPTRDLGSSIALPTPPFSFKCWGPTFHPFSQWPNMSLKKRN